jgi:hypothetical protein
MPPFASRVTAAVALTAALALTASPAVANGSGSLADVGDWSWYIAAGSGEWGVSEATHGSGWIAGSNAWDSSTFSLIAPTSYADPTSAEQGGDTLVPAVPVLNMVPFACTSVTLSADADDKIVSCNDTVTTPWGLSATSDVRVLAPGDLARITFFITNTTSAPVALGYQYSWLYGESSGHVRSTQPDVVADTLVNAGSLAAPDVWSFNYGNATATAAVAWGIAGEDLIGTSSSHNGYDGATVTLIPSPQTALAAGETVAISFFHKVLAPLADEILPPDPASAEADALAVAAVPQPAAINLTVTPAQFAAEFGSFSGRLTRGIPAGITVGNWQPAADTQLAATGAGFNENLLIGGIAAALLATGTTLLISRAARASRRSRPAAH